MTKISSDLIVLIFGLDLFAMDIPGQSYTIAYFYSLVCPGTLVGTLE